MSKRIEWDEIESYKIANALWQTTYMPNAWAKLVYKENQGLYIHMYVEEQNPRAIYKNNNDPVYKDSCLECFLNINPENNENYMNFEINANGAMLVGFGKERHHRQSLSVDFKPVAYKAENGWGYVLKVPEAFLLKYFGEISNHWKGNFYKCGDDCEQMHFLSWNKIELETPNFHCPEYFGNIEKK